MAHREFHDAHGTLWSVWDIHPTAGEALVSRDVSSHSPLGGERGSRTRAAPEYVAAALAAGWLCFESASEKRRLAPIPIGWEELHSAQLRDLCSIAAPVRRMEHRPEPRLEQQQA